MNLYTSDDPFAFGYGNGYGMVGSIDALDNVLLTPNPGNANGAGRRPEQKPLQPRLAPPGGGSAGDNKVKDGGGRGGGAKASNAAGGGRSREPAHAETATLPMARGGGVNTRLPKGAITANVHEPATIIRSDSSQMKPNSVPLFQQQQQLKPLPQPQHSAQLAHQAVGTDSDHKAIFVEAPPNGRRATVRKVFGTATLPLQEGDKGEGHAAEDVKRKSPSPTDEVRALPLNTTACTIPGSSAGALGQRNVVAVAGTAAPAGIATPRVSNTAPVSGRISTEAADNKLAAEQRVKKKDGWVEEPQEQIKTPQTVGMDVPKENGTQFTPSAPKSVAHGPLPPSAAPVNGSQEQPKAPPASVSPDIGTETGRLEAQGSLHSATWGAIMEVLRAGNPMHRPEDVAMERSRRATASTSVDSQQKYLCNSGRVSISIDFFTQSQVDTTSDKKWAEMELWAEAPLLMRNPPDKPLLPAGAVPEYAGEQMELDCRTHNVIAQVLHRDRPPQLGYPEQMPLELEKMQKKRRPRTPRSFYGVKGIKVSPDWYRKALEDVQHVKSPDLQFLEASEDTQKLHQGRKR
ncbi:uncharacterized protein Tco025E_02693 [Trypanosoma conorhini]|uniref:Uncharacterized protein n=1 Tax=Trypanosoma conorhini TaxID=83891 RepID=A0A3R7PDU1_9TRYP|nr:uncharacterized protein Tco025E_02693 [Trypanosoma conorhini]RNF23935.1 hypothetical protein Tco025E_02693 [Trypanosoma conorhini]